MSIKVLVPLPGYGFDPSEVAIPWKVLTQNEVEVIFATPAALPAQADERMLTGKGLGPLKPMLQARKDAIEAYRQLEHTEAFSNPIAYSSIQTSDYDALLLPGGHDKGVKEYLESPALQAMVSQFFAQGKPVAAICHGVVLAARSTDAHTGKSVLFGYRSTALLQSQEMLAYRLTRHRLGDYYLTYPGLTVQQEVSAALADATHFKTGPTPVWRDSPKQLQRGFTVRDRNYLSARWPGDAYTFAFGLLQMLKEI